MINFKNGIRVSSRRIVITAACVLLIASFSRAPQAQAPHVDASFLTGLQWRLVGPFRGGRAPAVVGDPENAVVFYMGTAHGGVWKTIDAGANWLNVSDRFFKLAS